LRDNEEAFIDVEDAFHTTGFDSIWSTPERRKIDPGTVEYIIRMLECRIDTAELEEEHITIQTTRGCPKRGVLSLVINKLFTNLEQQEFKVIGFAVNLA
jgi:hypothetical protein